MTRGESNGGKSSEQGPRPGSKSPVYVPSPGVTAQKGGNAPAPTTNGGSNLHAPPVPSDEEIVAWVSEHYSQELATAVRAALLDNDGFAAHLRRSFIREMTEPVR